MTNLLKFCSFEEDRLSDIRNLAKGLFRIRGRNYMKITYSMNPLMNHHEMKLTFHPKNKKLAKLLASQFKETLGEIEVYDDCRNKYPIAILGIYYFEMIDHKIFVYTENEVYRLPCISLASLKKNLKSFGFYQINVRTLVNVKHIKQYHKQKGCRRKITLDNGDVLISSRHYRQEFDEMMINRQYLEAKSQKVNHKKQEIL